MKNSLIIISGPSGVGKSTVLARLCQDKSLLIEDVITCTTRSMRSGEAQGEPYHFFSREEFEKKIKEDFFVEWAQVHQKFYYGIPKSSVEQVWVKNLCPIIDINVDGMRTIKKLYSQALTIFLMPPSYDTLKGRLEEREGLSAEELGFRLDSFRSELQVKGDFDITLVNDDLEKTIKSLKKIVKEYTKSFGPL